MLIFFSIKLNGKTLHLGIMIARFKLKDVGENFLLAVEHEF